MGANAGYYTSGQMPSYYIRDGGAGTTTNALIYFDLAGQIPAGATIDSATLSLYNTGNNAYIGGTVDLFRITDANNKGMWVEGNTSTAFDKTGAGWLRRAGTGDTVTTGWTNTSGSTIMDSVNGTASGNMTFATSAGWTSSTDIKSDIQAWANGSAVNQAWYMRVRSGTSINIQEVASNQYATAANRPKLTISYTTGTGSRPAGPTGYTFCANENQTCSFNGSASVAYGANGAFNYLTLTAGTPCTNAVFGDPLVGTAKACYYQTTTTPPPLSSVYLSAIQTYGNFETAGVDIKFKSLLSSETAKMFYKKTTDSTYKEGQPFTKYDGNHMARLYIACRLQNGDGSGSAWRMGRPSPELERACRLSELCLAL
ncbi:DNRLRE domain-containing protein [Paenibacillus rhizovicinus]|uniref:DNRLRE domain-containing protein n=1 Tax=Paenibacillus rhizovicinus TaxID=2704463 RepID=A0A6C0NW78_9BACL|nr:DNRLRE domain-containing protein [Paenibacillus rhizovicinus]QHW30460.1 DNRLRE domain-containing protein [Paenibacillus rhizovicinus]